MKTEELLIIALALGAAYVFTRPRTPIVSTVPATAPIGAYNPAYGYPSNVLNGASYANGGIQQRQPSTAQDVATYLGAIGGLASTASNIASDWA